MAKIKIITSPQDKPKKDSKFGNQTEAFSLNRGSRQIFNPERDVIDAFKSSSTMGPVPREEANLEAEKGETLVRPTTDGSVLQFNIGGKRHSEGGTPLQGLSGDFIFSDTKDMRIKDPEILKMFRQGGSVKPATPAELAKQYNINKYQAIANNPKSDRLEKDTAQRMIDTYTKKLQELAIYQESMKNFPNGFPQLMGSGEQGEQQAKYGGQMKYAPGGPVYNEWPFDGVSATPQGYSDPNFTWDGIGAYPTGPEGGISSNNNYRSPVNLISPQDLMVKQSLEVAPLQHQDVTLPKTNVGPIPGNANTTGYQPTPYRFSNQDLTSLIATGIVPPRTTMPVRSKVRLIAPEVTLPNETAAIAAQQSAINSVMQNNLMSGEGPRSRASNYGIIGQGLGQLQNIEGQYADRKAAAATRGSEQSAEISNRQALMDAESVQKYNAEMAQVLQNKDASTRNYLGALSQGYKQAKENATKIQIANAIHNKSPFYIDPVSNKLVANPHYIPDFETGMYGAGEKETGDMVSARAAEILRSGYVTDRTEAYKLAHQELMANRNKVMYNPMNPSQTKYTQSSIPNLSDGLGYSTGPYGQ